MATLNDYISRVSVARVVADTFELQENGHRYMKGVLHDSLVIDREKNIFYWNSIDLSGNALDWLTKVKGLSQRAALLKLSEYSKYPFERIVESFEAPTRIYGRLLEAFYNLGKGFRQYWYSRGFMDESIGKYKLGYTGNCYVFPFVTDGELINLQCRKVENGKKKVWRWATGSPLSLFGIDQVEDSEELFMLEGPPDVVALNQIGYSGVCNDGGLNTWNTEWNKYIVKFNKIYVLYDSDSAGINGAARISKKLLNRGYCIFWPFDELAKYDVNKLLLDSGVSKAREAIAALKELAIPEYLVTEYRKSNTFNEYLLDYRESKMVEQVRKEFYV